MLSLLYQHITARTDSFEVALKRVLSLIRRTEGLYFDNSSNCAS